MTARLALFGTCRSCGASLSWAKTASGKSIPLDPTPKPEGRFVLVDDGGRRPLAMLAATYDPEIVRDSPRYDDHFKACPHAGAWSE